MGNTASEEGMETKTILSPNRFVEAMYRLHGGSLDNNVDLSDLFDEMEFPRGETAKIAKQEAGEAGNVIVIQSIVSIQGDIRNDGKILFSERGAKDHQVTIGGSILVSGSPKLSPKDTLLKKIVIDPAPDETDFEIIGYALPSPEQTGHIGYLFQIFKARLADVVNISSTGSDKVSLIPIDEAENAIQQKPLEVEVLRELREVMSTSYNLKKEVIDLVTKLPNNRESVDNLMEIITILQREERCEVDRLLGDKSDVTDKTDTSFSEFFSQPKILQLSDDETLNIHLQRPETVADVRNDEWPIIQTALEQNPEFMQALKAHENMGAELTIAAVETDDNGNITTVEFENVADNLDIEAQERALVVLMADGVTVDAYVQDRLSKFDEDDQEEAEKWLREWLNRQDGVSGLNYIEADMLMWKYGGGRLISHDRLQRQAEQNPKLCENTVTWHHKDDLKEIKNKHTGNARNGFRHAGNADYLWSVACHHSGLRGGRVSGLKLQIT